MLKKSVSIFLVVILLLTMGLSASAVGGSQDKTEPYDPNPSVRPRTVFGDDESWFATPKDGRGYKAVAKLYIYFPDSSTPREGTGFLYGDHAMGTAAHCLYDGRYGGKATKIKVVLPHKTVVVDSSKLRYPSQWSAGSSSTVAGDWQYDYGTITLPAGTASEGYFGLYTNGAKVGDTCLVSGYRAGEYKARISRDKIRSVGPYDLEFRHDILSGQSGAPIYDDDYYVVGIFNYNAGFATHLKDTDEGENSGAKMTPAVFNFFKAIL